MKYQRLLLTLGALAVACLPFAQLSAADAPKASPADLTKPVQVFILLGQSNMVGLGKVTGPDGSLDFAVKNKKKYPHLIDADGNWSERTDVRNVRVMVGRSGGMRRRQRWNMSIARRESRILSSEGSSLCQSASTSSESRRSRRCHRQDRCVAGRRG